ncbi:Pentatricopeptide repeat-containing protein [Nymphaea thermarum]|nr:Pentatricopeptide repeat-containing protein [Nymphaea thermarum]
MIPRPRGRRPCTSSLVNILLERCTTSKLCKQALPLLITSGIIQDSCAFPKIISAMLSFFSDINHDQNIISLVHEPDTFIFNTIITAFAGDTNKPVSAISYYKLMVGRGLWPDIYTFPAILKSCSKVSGLMEAIQFHGNIVKWGLAEDLYVQNALVHVYACCGKCCDARQMFDEMVEKDVVTWTSIIGGYAKGGHPREALQLFLDMDVKPNAATMVSMLSACAQLGASDKGRGIHGSICKYGFQVDQILGNALMDMYVKCGCLDDANWVFKEMTERDIVSWTTLISGLSQNDRPKGALQIFHDMQMSGIEPDRMALTSALSACASLGALAAGRWIHQYMDRKHIEWDVHVGTAVVDMYAKCGCIERALQVFHKMHHRNVRSWNVMLGGLAMHGHGRKALAYFSQMVESGIRPNEVTFLAVLGACSHSGFVEEGIWHFHSIRNVYNLMPKIEHYGCMVDLLGRAGRLEEARVLIKSMPMQADVRIWGAMLSACKAYGDMKLCQTIRAHITELEAADSGVYVLISNIYATNNRWEDVKRMRALMRDKGIRKSPGSSFIEVNCRTHEFMVDDVNHPQHKHIQFILGTLTRHMELECLGLHVGMV